MRLSRDDEKAGESLSIENQRIILQKFVTERGGVIADEYIDDGWSGTSFDRPEVKRLLDDAQAGKIQTIVVKDLSRFGRNYIQVGQYIDYIFPAYGIRFIAVGDHVDTAERGSAAMDMMPIMNVFNEWHAANTSKKIRAALEASQRSGKYTSWNYPYGYQAGRDVNRTAVIDAEAASVVKRIFDLRLQGNSYRAIAIILTNEGIPNPATYFTRLNGEKSGRRCSPYWSPKTVMSILCDRTYTGITIQHKTTGVSYKNRRSVRVPEEERIVKPQAHEPIVSLALWERVQEVNRAPSGRRDKANRLHTLSGLLVCADCGKRLKLKSARGDAENCCFVCRTYVDLGKKYCTSHFITERQLEAVVLRDICSFPVLLDEEKAKEGFLKEKARRDAQSKASDGQRLRLSRIRLHELDRLLQSAFEEKLLNRLPEGVFASLCESYQSEKEVLQKTVGELEKSIAHTNDADADADRFLAVLRFYGRFETLTRELCLQLIDHITVGESNGVEREIEIFYKCKLGHMPDR